MLDFILLLLAIICLGLASLNVSVGARVSLGWLGLFFFVLIPFLKALNGL